MDTIKSNDCLDLRQVIYKALPGALVAYCENFDDLHLGYDICPLPGTLIRLMIEMDNPLNIKIVKYIAETWSGNLRIGKMYHGPIPPTSDMGPDFDFVTQLLKNWENIG